MTLFQGGSFILKSGIPLYLNDEIQGNCILLDLNSNYWHISNNIWLFKSKIEQIFNADIRFNRFFYVND